MTSPVTTTIERFCLHCGVERQVHIETGRCQSCGKSAVDPRVLAQQPPAPIRAPNGFAAPTPKQPELLVLKETPALRRWLALTQEVAKSLSDRAERASGFAERFQKEARHLSQGAAAFNSLLSQIGIEPDDPPAKSLGSGAGRPKPDGRWARQHDACVKCGTTEVSHASNGLCKRCYDRSRGK